jgi:hypothetical protein
MYEPGVVKFLNVGLSVFAEVILVAGAPEGLIDSYHKTLATIPSESEAEAPEVKASVAGNVIDTSEPAFAVGGLFAAVHVPAP